MTDGLGIDEFGEMLNIGQMTSEISDGRWIGD